jgi:hypothetical protein
MYKSVVKCISILIVIIANKSLCGGERLIKVTKVTLQKTLQLLCCKSCNKWFPPGFRFASKRATKADPVFDNLQQTEPGRAHRPAGTLHSLLARYPQR